MAADHKVHNEGGESRNNHRYSVVVQDLATQWNSINLIRAKRKLLRRRKRVDGSFSSRRKSRKSLKLTIHWNFGKSSEDLSWNHRTSTHLAERAVRRIKEGTSAVVLQSGLDEKWWAGSSKCFCYLRNVQDFLADGKTPYERRFGEPFEGPVILFAAKVEYQPISARDQPRLQNLVRKFYLGYSSALCINRG